MSEKTLEISWMLDLTSGCLHADTKVFTRGENQVIGSMKTVVCDYFRSSKHFTGVCNDKAISEQIDTIVSAYYAGFIKQGAYHTILK
jgi:hypothetical protein